MVVYIEKPKKTATFDAVAAAYMRNRAIEGKLSGSLERTVRRFVAAFAGMECHEITQESVETLMDPELKANTIAYRVNVLKAVLNYGYTIDMISEKPRLKAPRYFDERDEHLSEVEAVLVVDWLRKNADPLVSLAVATLIHTGVRVNELCALEGRSFSHDTMIVSKKKGKTRDTRVIPYTRSYRDGFTPSRLAMVRGRVFATLAVSPAAMSEVLGRELKKALAGVGIDRNVRVHDLRHTFAFLCGSAGVDLGDLQILMGHSNISMTMRYRGFIQSRAADVMKNI